MALVNEHFLKLPGSYLFSDIAKKVNTFRITHRKLEVIRLGIGDVTRPLPPACIEAMHRAVDEMTNASTFHGYGPEQGYDFLIEAIIKHDYAPRGIHFSPTEVFVNDGAKSDTGNIGDILRHDNSVGVTDPIYPVYIDSNVMCGRAGVLEEDGKWSNVTYMPCTAENNFVPEIPDKRIDIVYLCYPNNPTGTTLTKSQLKKLTASTLTGERIPLNRLWNRRQCTKFNGTSYITQRAAEAIYTPAGKQQIKENIDYYMNNARTMKEGLEAAGLKVYGGVNAPYIWLKAPNGIGSWRFFEQMLYEANVVGTPGVGFGPSGEGYIRLTAFGNHEDCVEAMRRIRKWLACK